jgi:hypothetical protein
VRKKSRVRLIVLASIISGLLSGGLTACSKSGASVQESSPQAQQAPQPKRLTPADLAKLRWIEGAWRGTGDIEKPFYERYHFEDESTLVVEGFTDETLGKVTEITRFVLKDGSFGNSGEGSLWVATELGDDSVTFEPLARARNSFRWQRESTNTWKATLDWPAAGNNPARRRVYLMERLPTAKGAAGASKTP